MGSVESTQRYLQISMVSELLQVASNANFVLVRRTRNVIRGVVERTQAGRGDYGIAARWRSRKRAGILEKVREVGIVLDGRRALLDKASSLHALHGAEVCRRSDDGDVLVKDAGKAIVHRADNVVVALPVPERLVLRSEHLLRLRDRHANGDEVSRRGTTGRSGVETMCKEPCLNKIDGVGVRSNERCYFLLGQVLTIPEARTMRTIT